MTRTILFFGDSNTRGFGVGREARFATLVESELKRSIPEASNWTFALTHAESDFRAIRQRLEPALEKYTPRIVHYQCPTGPACYFVKAPRWVRTMRRPFELLLQYRQRKHIAAEMAQDPSRTPHEVLYDGRFLDDLYRLEPRRWRLLRPVNPILARLYGLDVKADLPRYLTRMLEIRERIRAKGVAEIVFLGLIAADENIYPGYGARSAEWTKTLRAELHRPEAGSRFVEPLRHLDGATEPLLLKDGTHLTPLGHRKIAEVVAPVLGEIIRAA